MWAFQRDDEEEVCALPLSLPKGRSKSELFLFLNKTQLQLNEVCYKAVVQSFCCLMAHKLQHET